MVVCGTMLGMEAKTPPRTKRVQLYLPPDLHRALKVHAARTDTSASALAEEFIRVGLTKQGATS